MTCILAVRNKKGKLVMASDRRETVSHSGDFAVTPAPKIMNIHGLIIGGAGDSGPINLFFSLKKLKFMLQTETPLVYLMTHVIPEFRDVLKAAGMAADPGDDPRTISSEFLIACAGHLYSVQNFGGEVHCNEVATPFAAGCGGTTALASFVTMQQHAELYKHISFKERLREACRITALLNAGCDDNIDILSE